MKLFAAEKLKAKLVKPPVEVNNVLWLMAEGVDLGVAKYAAWKIDKDQNGVFEKIRTIHMQLVKAMNPAKKETSPCRCRFYFLWNGRRTSFFPWWADRRPVLFC